MTAGVAVVAIVVVSHSRALAQAAVDLATGLVTGLDVVVEVAAGLEDGALGTDTGQILAAIETAARAPGGKDGVLVLADLGSSIMSAETALELADPELAARTRLSPAPLVEGLVGAYVAAGIGRSLEEVAAEAASAPEAKRRQMSS
ncbi:dihydroxyacetone kinase phosphoryl donor subunit DhaM [Actinomyces howellii]|uniref:phosphoenolpyruvate--glycerone phosphotransferase n=1 Tax=Actinomyces howellii TaxID=52771 RepID=A0A3S4SLJ5_9ACTO|nr:dihydroxyacetone kinase phosphoryl donor subunit DhaM [Actinomyces howellii]VEG26094.1 PTS-dependent dihydroxyacetone kinase, phosphotransferase subunit dhaM [Actinomyces howellii]